MRWWLVSMVKMYGVTSNMRVVHLKIEMRVFRTILLTTLIMIKFINRKRDNFSEETCALHKF